jgi:hypothetical protein
MKKAHLIVDLDGVVQEPLLRHIIKWSMEKDMRGRRNVPSAEMLAAIVGYRLGHIGRKQMAALAPFFTEGRHARIPYLPRSAYALKELSKLYPGRVHICSNTSYEEDSDDTYVERLESDFGRGAFADVMLLPFTASKKAYFEEVAREADGGRVIVLDDSARKCRQAKIAGCEPVLVGGKPIKGMAHAGELYDFMLMSCMHMNAKGKSYGD